VLEYHINANVHDSQRNLGQGSLRASVLKESHILPVDGLQLEYSEELPSHDKSDEPLLAVPVELLSDLSGPHVFVEEDHN